MEEQNNVKKEEAIGSDPGPKKKRRILNAITGLGRMIYQVFKDYPVTMFAIIAAAFIGAILVDIDNRDLEDALEKLAGFFLLSAGQVIMYEEVFKSKLAVRISGYVASGAIAAFSVYYILTTESTTLFGTDSDTVIEICVRILAVYLTALLLWAVYHMFVRLEEDFEIYCTKAFLGLVKANFIYLLFAAGLAVIILIFNELIFDTDEFLSRVELFLAGGIYVPMCLKAISSKGEKPGKFAKLCVVYVLQSMLLIAFAIIYIYIIKIFVTDSVPSNQVFYILAFLFAIGMPIWTMVHSMREEEGFLSKVAEYVPYAFVPFILLQCWSMGIRIREYGYTASRYMAILLVIGEVIYFVLYVLHQTGRKKAISWILFFLMLIAAFGLIIPGTCYDDVVIRSQTKRLSVMMDQVEADPSLKSAIKSAYRTIDGVGYKGKKALDKTFTKTQIAEIEEYSEYNQWGRDRIYLRYEDNKKCIDVSGYVRMYKTYGTESSVPDELGNVKVTVYGESGTEIKYPVNVNELVDWAAANFTDRNSDDFDLTGRDKIKIDDLRDMYITQCNMNIYEDNGEVESIRISGYILER